MRSGKRAQALSDPCCVRIEECLKTTPQGAERLDRRSEVLNEALAKEVERNARRGEEIGNTGGELAAPQELKDMPIPPDSDPRKRRAIKAATVVAISGSSQMEGNRAVAETPTQQHSRADGSRMDVEGEERDESRSSKAQNIRRRIMTKTSMKESRMDDDGEEGDVPNTRRRIATKTSLEENNIDERTVAVTTQESLGGFREKAMRIASLGELGASSSSRRAENDRNKKVNEIVRAFVGSIMSSQVKAVERHEFETNNTKLEREACRRCEETRISVESVHQQRTTGELLENQ